MGIFLISYPNNHLTPVRSGTTALQCCSHQLNSTHQVMPGGKSPPMNEYGVHLWPEFQFIMVEILTNHFVTLQSTPKEWCLETCFTTEILKLQNDCLMLFIHILAINSDMF